jgi:hypothetical protein
MVSRLKDVRQIIPCVASGEEEFGHYYQVLVDKHEIGSSVD